MPRKNPVRGYTNQDSSWYTYTPIRHKTDAGVMVFTPDNLPSGGLWMKLYKHGGEAFTDVIHFTQVGKEKVVATDVKAGTKFHIAAHKGRGDDRFWSGSFYY